MRGDLHNNANFKLLFPPIASVTNNTAQVSSIIDTAGYDSCELVLITGTLTDADATFAVLLEDGNDSALADNAEVVAPNLLGTEVLAGFNFASDNKVFKIGYLGTKRYLRVTVTPANNTGDLYLAGVAVMGPNVRPSANPPN